MSATDAARYAERQAWQVFPITAGRKEPPLVKWAEEATNDLPKLRQWWGRWPNANIGLACGKRSRVIVLDVDAGHGGNQSLLQLQVNYGQLPQTVVSMTGGGGQHILFQHPGVEIRNSAGKLGPGLDIRGDGGYIVLPPSLHPSGKCYAWAKGLSPDQTQLASMPEWLVNLLADKPQAPQPSQPAAPVGEKITAGARNQTLASLAGSMRRRGMSTDAILAALKTENTARCLPPLPDEEVAVIARSISRYTPSDPPQIRGSEAPVKRHEPLNAYQGVAAFLDLLEHLDGRSIKTGIPSFDRAVGGLERQTLTILAARPSMGKSTLAWQKARGVAAGKMRAIFFSLEMSTASLWAKAACGALGIRWRDVRNGDATPEQLDRIATKATELMDRYGDYLLTDDQMNTTQTIWETAEKYRPDLIVVDHLRLVADRDDSEVQRLGIITQKLKDTAKAFNCAVLALAQLNRGTEARADENKRPQLADLRDSGQIEENADLVLMMFREDYYNPPAAPTRYSMTELLVRKFRDDVNSQRIVLAFDTNEQWFYDAETVDLNALPVQNGARAKGRMAKG